MPEMIHDKKQSMKISLATYPLKNEWADNREQCVTVWHKSTEINRWQTDTRREQSCQVSLRSNDSVHEKPSTKKKAPCWKKDSSKDSDSYFTFDKNLGEALLLPDHALVRCVIRQVALVDSECPLVAHAFKHIPGYAQGWWGKIIQGAQRTKPGERGRETMRERVMNKCFQQIEPQSYAEGLKTAVTHG